MTEKGSTRPIITLLEASAVVALLVILGAAANHYYKTHYRVMTSANVLVNVKSIADGAVVWYESEHTDKAGNPLPRHFPHSGSPYKIPATLVEAVAPKSYPCKGKSRTLVDSRSIGTKYQKNPGLWNRAPWLQLQFKLSTQHRFQYRFRTQGVGKKATFYIRAYGDRDCNFVLERVRLKGKVLKTGKVSRSKIVVVNQGE